MSKKTEGMSSPAFSNVFQTIQQLKAEHAAQERTNMEALEKAKKEIEALLKGDEPKKKRS